jgi:hypothetical protein
MSKWNDVSTVRDFVASMASYESVVIIPNQRGQNIVVQARNRNDPQRFLRFVRDMAGSNRIAIQRDIESIAQQLASASVPYEIHAWVE